MTILQFTKYPSTTAPATFAADMDQLLSELPARIDAANADTASVANAVATIANSTAIVIPYTFSTTTTDADPGNGLLRLDNATQNLATTIRADLQDNTAVVWTAVLDTFGPIANTLNGVIRLVHATDPTKWLQFDVTAIASPAGYRNITVVNTGSSGASPFANSDSIKLYFWRAGLEKWDVNTQNVSAELALTAASARLQVLTPTVQGQHAKLPDATTLQRGEKFVIKVPQTAAYELGIRDNSGALLRAVRPGGVARLVLHDISTAAGGWSVAGDLLSRVFTLRANTISAGRTFSSTYTLKLSNTLVVYLGRESSTLYGRAHDLSTDTLGAWTSLDASWTTSDVKHAFRVSDTSGIAFNASTSQTRAVAFSVSGTTITPGTPQNATANTGLGTLARGLTVVQLSDTLYCTFGYTTLQPHAQACSVSGTTITWGSQTNMGAALTTTAPAYAACVMRSATQALVWYTGSSPFVFHCSHLSFSGTTITHDSRASATAALSAGARCASMPVAMGADEWWLLHSVDGSNVRPARWTVSGTTVSVTEHGSNVAMANIMDDRHLNTLIKVSATTAWIIASNASTNGAVALAKLAWSGSFTVTSHSYGAAMPGLPVSENAFQMPKLDGDTQKAIYVTAFDATTLVDGAQPGQLVWIDETFSGDVPIARCVAYSGQFYSNGNSICVAAVDTDRWRAVIGNAMAGTDGGAMAGRVVLMPKDQNPGRAIIEEVVPIAFNTATNTNSSLAPGVLAGDKLAFFGARTTDGYGLISLLEIADVA